MLTPQDSAHHQQLTYLLMLTFPISSLQNASKKIHIFFLLPTQGSLQFLSLDLDYNNNNFICTKRLSVVQFGCLLDVRKPRGAALDQKGTEMDDALNFIIL